MAGKKSKDASGRRTTIYRLTGVESFEDAIRPKYLARPGFHSVTVRVGERDGYLVTGAMAKDKVDWCGAVAALTGVDITVAGSTPAGVLLLRPSSDATDDTGVAYALTYGMGFQLLEPSHLDNLFGQRVAIRTADSAKLRSLTVTTMEERSRTSRATIPQGDGLLGFGVGDVGEAVSRIVAEANLPQLSRSQGKPLQLRGSDALNVPIGLAPAEVIADLDALERVLAADPPEALKVLEQLAAVKNPRTKELLDSTLSKALDTASSLVGLAWPYERIDENGTPDSWTPANLWPRGQNHVRQGQPEWDEIASALATYPTGRRLDRVDRATIQMFRDAEGQEPISQAIPLRRWIAFQTELDGRAYALYDGGWYQVHNDYAENINSRTAEIFARRVEDLAFPTWDTGMEEAAYNEKLAAAVGGACLDKKLITTRLHRRGIEACDVYVGEGTLIHVKKTDRSTAASHLIAQALVSTDSLCNDSEAREAVRERIADAGGDPDSFGSKPKRVILAMHRSDGRRGVTAEELFTFTKVNLVRQATALEERGVEVRIVSIPLS
ncbi:DUF6119 family protein [Cellulosimicrobium funkei]|uniref:DUF6119 family protein n=1 Tax=Cellulosimicrobium funkei TaxID=264251 RepID=UPI0030F6DCFF